LFYKQNYGYSVGQLWDLLQEIRVHYNEVLMQHWVQVFRDILDEDSFLPIQVINYYHYMDNNIFSHYIVLDLILFEMFIILLQVTTQLEYDEVLNLFPYHDEELEKAEFPKKFPFSDMVPKIYQQVKEFIYACLKFSEDLNFTQAEIDEMICKSTNLLLTRTFSGCLSSLFRKPSLALLQVVQIIINTGYLEKSTKYLEEFVTNITG